MEDVINSVFKNTKAAYKESVMVDNEKLQDLLILILADVKKLEYLNNEEKINSTVGEKKVSGKKTTYTNEQVSSITKIQLKLARKEISFEEAEDEILKVSPTFPVQHLVQYNKRVQKYLAGGGEYGFAFPSNWAKALLKETNNNPLVIKALKEQQALYLEKDNYINKKLASILNGL